MDTNVNVTLAQLFGTSQKQMENFHIFFYVHDKCVKLLIKLFFFEAVIVQSKLNCLM